ncbi:MULTISPECIES: acyl carrier protein [Glycomyces]|uniref:Acyl carrier protein n=1 Tax=Glycomyces artemisiae TaxID=1076443 RepID=A0A2T0UPK9_9ACTN|nr:phosphopantetheine-binding protein [Glycomyces artemisiae]PRY59844.1 acyl carrier protein [Glycomyces artemisiae]
MSDALTAKARELVARILEIAPDEVADDADFRDDLEADSLQLAEINAVLEDDLGLDTLAGEPPASFAEIRDLLAAKAAR